MDIFTNKINKLQDVFSVIGCDKINFPQIVLVGTQNSGKSSVLESLVGKSFLPKGIGMATKAPLVLQRIRYSNQDYEELLKKTGKKTVDEWVIFDDKPNEILFDFDAVHDEIKKRTNQITGNNKCLTREQIVLKLYTRHYNLTFIDLPGMKTISEDNQQQDLDQQYISKLISHYTEQPNSIVLFILSAHEINNHANNENLKIANSFIGRTIAVVTKLDLVDRSTLIDSINILGRILNTSTRKPRY
jgi:dynamin 1-like protein|uniref:Dynamin-1-like protein n=1 Tax=Sipha flava TaxID=143950 RepID=A0A2S2QEJ3_9HEMI